MQAMLNELLSYTLLLLSAVFVLAALSALREP